MAQTNHIGNLCSRLLQQFPNLNLRPEDISGYFFKKIGTSERYYSIRKTNEQSRQYHLAFTSASQNMTLFPLLTSFEYHAGDSSHKSTIIGEYRLTLFLPNLIAKAQNIMDQYDALVTSLGARNPRERFVLTKNQYIELKQHYDNLATSSDWLDTFFQVTFNKRRSGQLQLEVGASPARYTEEFTNFRRLTLDDDWLIVIKRLNTPEYIFILITSTEYSSLQFDQLPNYFKIGNDGMTIKPQKMSEITPETAIEEDSKILFYYLQENLPQDSNTVNIEITSQELGEELKVNDFIYILQNIGGVIYLNAIGIITLVNTFENITALNVDIIQKDILISLEELIGEGFVEQEMLDQLNIPVNAMADGDTETIRNEELNQLENQQDI